MAQSAPAKKASPPPAKAATPPAKKADNAADAETERKSIVPAKYANKYKNGGEGPTAEFIKDQCTEKDGTFSFSAFFDVARKNGIAEDKVSTYEQAVKEEAHGARGRARMTLGNMLRAKARKEQKLAGLNGKPVDVAEAQLEVKGAAKAAQDAKAAKK